MPFLKGSKPNDLCTFKISVPNSMHFRTFKADLQVFAKIQSKIAHIQKVTI